MEAGLSQEGSAQHQRQPPTPLQTAQHVFMIVFRMCARLHHSPGVCGASPSSPGRLVLSDLIGAGDRQMVMVRQNHIVPTQHVTAQNHGMAPAGCTGYRDSVFSARKEFIHGPSKRLSKCQLHDEAFHNTSTAYMSALRVSYIAGRSQSCQAERDLY